MLGEVTDEGAVSSAPDSTVVFIAVICQQKLFEKSNCTLCTVLTLFCNSLMPFDVIFGFYNG